MRKATEIIERIDGIRRRLSDGRHCCDQEWLTAELERLRTRLVEIDDELAELRAIRSMTWGE